MCASGFPKELSGNAVQLRKWSKIFCSTALSGQRQGQPIFVLNFKVLIAVTSSIETFFTFLAI